MNQEIADEVKKITAANPNISIKRACTQLGVSYTTYYDFLKKSGKSARGFKFKRDSAK